MSAQEVVKSITELVASLKAEGVRIDERSGRLSVLDIIASRKKTKYPSVEFQRLSRKHPELEERVHYHQFPGRRQNQTPTINADHLPYLFKILSSRTKGLKRPSVRPRAPLLAIVASARPRALQPEAERPSPYGWRWDDAGECLHPIHAEQQTIRYIRQLRAFGERFSDIARQLERDGILPRHGDPWSAEEIEELLEFDHEPLFKDYDQCLRDLRRANRKPEQEPPAPARKKGR
jgi:hypothetical protein